MNELSSNAFIFWIRRIFIVAMIGGLIALVYLVLTPFFVPIAWALVLAYITWPVHKRLKKQIGNWPTLCALIMVSSMVLLILLPLLWLTLIIQDNVVDSYRSLGMYLAKGSSLLPEPVLNIPWLGQELQRWLNAHLGDATALNQELMDWGRQRSDQLIEIFGSVGRNTAKAVFTSVVLFVLYRDGEKILHSTKLVLVSLFGERVNLYLSTIGGASRAIMFGVILIAIVQGIIAGIGFLVFGIPNIVLLGTLTALASLVPIVGTFLIWGPISLWLLIHGQLWPALGLFLWGSFLISAADNLIRPLVISQAMRVSFVLVMFGIFGGLVTFGLIGLFIGPIVLAVALTAWKEWVQSIKHNP